MQLTDSERLQKIEGQLQQISEKLKILDNLDTYLETVEDRFQNTLAILQNFKRSIDIIISTTVKNEMLNSAKIPKDGLN